VGFCGVLGVVSTGADGGVFAAGTVGAGATAGSPFCRTLLGGIGVGSGAGAGGSGAFC